MKRVIALVLLSIVITFNGFSQPATPYVDLTELTHAYTPSTYITLSGIEKVGDIKFNEINTHFFWFKAQDEKAVKIFAKDVKLFKYNNIEEYITLKKNFHIKANKENKVKIYKRFVREKGNTANAAPGRVFGEYNYFIIISDVLELKSINDISLLPFHKKVSVLLKDCPELSKKISKKEKGYKKTLITTRYKLWKKFATEYENCK